MKNDSCVCCFFGHREISESVKLKDILYENIEKLITKENVRIFLFGSKSQFNDLCHEIVTKLKETYPFVKRIYVRAEFPYIDDSYKTYLLEKYEDTYYPEKLINAGRAVYVKRNYEMIDKSDFCVVYYSGIKNLSLNGRFFIFLPIKAYSISANRNSGTNNSFICSHIDSLTAENNEANRFSPDSS